MNRTKVIPLLNQLHRYYNTTKIKTFFFELDKLLEGGLIPGYITNVTSQVGIGDHYFIRNLLINYLDTYQKPVLFINFDSKFSFRLVEEKIGPQKMDKLHIYDVDSLVNIKLFLDEYPLETFGLIIVFYINDPGTIIDLESYPLIDTLFFEVLWTLSVIAKTDIIPVVTITPAELSDRADLLNPLLNTVNKFIDTNIEILKPAVNKYLFRVFKKDKLLGSLESSDIKNQ